MGARGSVHTSRLFLVAQAWIGEIAQNEDGLTRPSAVSAPASRSDEGGIGKPLNDHIGLNRLLSANATNGTWGQAFTYDGFGNLMQKSVTQGSAPTLSVTYDPATNHQSGIGVTYDANGNPGTVPYDVENRPLWQGSINGPRYSYDPQGKRLLKINTSSANQGELYFYGIGGQKLATYQCANDGNGNFHCPSGSYSINVYFGGQLIRSKGVTVATDRLGSVRANSNGERFSYYPYGEERTTTVDGREKFGTYMRDGPGQDYADQRYYAVGMGRFNTADPYEAGKEPGFGAGDPSDPQSWNQYAYVEGDPINYYDPEGLFQVVPRPRGPGTGWDPTPGGGGEGGRAGSKGKAPIKPNPERSGGGHHKADVQLHFSLVTPCPKTAEQVIADAESNFAAFGNFVGLFGPGGLPTSVGTVTFSPVQITPGASIPITITTTTPPGSPIAITNTFNVSVDVQNSTDTGFTFTTTPGHLLYPASISFTAQNLSSGQLGFSIDISGDYANGAMAAAFSLGGNDFEGKQWNNFLQNVKIDCNK